MPPKSNGSSMRLSGREGGGKVSFSLALGSTPLSLTVPSRVLMSAARWPASTQNVTIFSSQEGYWIRSGPRHGP